MAEVLQRLRRIDVPTTALGAAMLIASFEARKQAVWYQSVTKNVGRFDDSIIPIAVGVVGMITNQPLLERMIIVGLMLAIHDSYLEWLAKEPYVKAIDASTLELTNFDASSAVHAVVDGKPVSFATAPTTDSNGYAKVTLPSALASGTHRIVVWTEGGKAFAGFIAL